MPSYRHLPLSQRLGLSFDASAYWQVAMPEAECFMYFVANLHRLFGKGYVLYVEGRQLDADVLALYQEQAARSIEKVAVFDRNPATQRLHVAMGTALQKRMNSLAASKTYAEMGEAMLVYKEGQVWMDGSRLGERIVRLNGLIRENDVKTFAGGYLRGEISWQES